MQSGDLVVAVVGAGPIGLTATTAAGLFSPATIVAIDGARKVAVSRDGLASS